MPTSLRDRLMDEMRHLIDVVGLEDLTVPERSGHSPCCWGRAYTRRQTSQSGTLCRWRQQHGHKGGHKR
jgi:hypothetical protein